MDNVEDRGTVDYLADTADAGRPRRPRCWAFATSAFRAGASSTSRTRRSRCCSSSIPWEWLLRRPVRHLGRHGARVRMVEPAWKMMLSSKGILPLLWRLAPRHPNLLPAFFEGDPAAAALGADLWVRKPIHSREGANITIVERGSPLRPAPAGPTAGPRCSRPSIRCPVLRRPAARPSGPGSSATAPAALASRGCLGPSRAIGPGSCRT